MKAFKPFLVSAIRGGLQVLASSEKQLIIVVTKRGWLGEAMRAKQLQVKKWTNVSDTFQFDVYADSIKVIHVFQMLCPGCVYKCIPQAVQLFQHYKTDEVKVIGLHSVFENHHVMTEAALDVFIKEWRLPFPVGIDLHLKDEWMPETMKAYHLQGTPSTIVVDHLGEIRLVHFGHIETVELCALINGLIESKLTAQLFP